MTSTELTLSEYQRAAAGTDILDASDPVMPLLGLAGEIGQLVAEYKKRRRDGEGYRAFKEEVREELGDLLWYAAALARHTDLDLEEVARENLTKINELFAAGTTPPPHDLFDAEFSEEEQLPRQLTVTLVETEEHTDHGKLLRVRMYQGTDTIGAPLDDNSAVEDDYRYHDVLHLAHMAVLGWSPVLRGLLRRKRRLPAYDRIEDGGRAAALEEGLTAYVFSVAARHTLFASSSRVPLDALKMCRQMTAQLEVKERTRADWQYAILAGYEVFREVIAHRGGTISADLDRRTLTYDAPPSDG